jgi:hypothetical protein
VEALVVGGAEIAAGAVLICVGPATEAFLASLGVRMPVGRVPGLLALTSPPAEPLRRVVHAPGVHLRPEAGGGLLVGADDVDAARRGGRLAVGTRRAGGAAARAQRA